MEWEFQSFGRDNILDFVVFYEHAISYISEDEEEFATFFVEAAEDLLKNSWQGKLLNKDVYYLSAALPVLVMGNNSPPVAKHKY